MKKILSIIMILVFVISIFPKNIAFADEIPVDKTVLITAVADGNTLWSTSVSGTDVGQYDLFDRFDYYYAVFNAQAVVDNASATQSDVDTAVITLATATSTFKSKVVVPILSVKTTLKSKINLANMEIARSVAGTDAGDYAQTDITTFIEAIATAQAVVDNVNAIQTDVDSAVTTLTIAKYTFESKVVNAEQPLVFADINLKNAFCSWMNQAPNTALYKSAIKSRVNSGNDWLQFYSKNITSLSGMENLSDLNFRIIDFGDNNISDLSPLSNFNFLKNLNVQMNKVSDIDCLANLPLVNTLEVNDNLLNNNAIKIFAHPGAFPSLESLDLSENTISDLTPLSSLSKINYLYIKSNNLTDVSPLQNLTTLDWLWLDSNNISDISSFKNLTNLTSLDLAQNKITDISCISFMPKLKIGRAHV